MNNKKGIPLIGIIAVVAVAVICLFVFVLGKDDESDKGSGEGTPQAQLKSSMSADLSQAKVIKTSVEVSLGNESIFELCVEKPTVITLVPGQEFKGGTDCTYSGASNAMRITGVSDMTWMSSSERTLTEVQDMFAKEMSGNLGGKVPEISYTYNPETQEEVLNMNYYVYISNKGTVEVYVGPSGLESAIAGQTDSDLSSVANGEKGFYQLLPDTCDSYK